MARRHLAIFLSGVAEKILSGEKKIEIRLSKNKAEPYLSVAKNDEILLKNSGGKVIGKAEVDNVLYYDELSPSKISELKENYFQEAAMDSSFWDKKQGSKFATVIILKNPVKFITPIVYKKADRRAWLKLEENLDKKGKNAKS